MNFITTLFKTLFIGTLLSFYLPSLLAKETLSITIPYNDFQTISASQTGMIALEKGEYQKLLSNLDKLDEFKKNQEIEGYALVKSTYNGKQVSQGFEFDCELEYQLRGKAFKKIPLFFKDISLSSIKGEGGIPLSLIPPPNETEPYYFATSEEGVFRIKATFYTEIKDPKPGHFEFKIPLSPITLLELSHSRPGIQFKSSQALPITNQEEGGIYKASLKPEGFLSVTLNEKIQETVPASLTPELTDPEGEKKIFLEGITLGRITDGLCQAESTLQFEVHRGEVEEIFFNLSEEALLLDITGVNKLDWETLKVSGTPGMKRFRVWFPGRLSGKFTLNISYEKSFDPQKKDFSFPILQVENLFRVAGFLGITTSENAEINIIKTSQLRPMEPNEFQARNPGGNPVLHSFSFTDSKVDLTIGYHRHEEVRMKTTAIDQYLVKTLITREGHLVHQILLEIRNTSQQFLAMKPESSLELWGVWVNGRSVQAGFDDDKNLQIPLDKSNTSGNNLISYPILVTFHQNLNLAGGRSGLAPFLGQLGMELPSLPLDAKKLTWRVYLPPEYKWYRFPEGNVLRQEIQEPFPFGEKTRLRGQAAQSKYSRLDPTEARQLATLFRGKHLTSQNQLPVEFPETSNFYQFHKDILEPHQKPPWLYVHYSGYFFLELFRFLLFLIGFSMIMGLWRMIFESPGLILGGGIFILGGLGYFSADFLEIPFSFIYYGGGLALSLKIASGLGSFLQNPPFFKNQENKI